MDLQLFPLTIRSVHPPIPCLLSRPKEELRSAATVIYFHSLNGARDQIFKDRYLEFALAMRTIGCNLLSIELPCHGERRKNVKISPMQNILHGIGSDTQNPFACIIEDTHKIIDFLIEKRIARVGEIGIAGMAWGAVNAFCALCNEPRIRCSVLFLPVCRISSMTEFRPLKGQAIVEQFEPMNYVKNIAPKPLLFITGEKDQRANPQYTSELYQKLLPEYEAIHAREKLAYKMLLGVAHQYESQMTALAIEWFNKYLFIGKQGSL